jgi:hypothetical protein
VASSPISGAAAERPKRQIGASVGARFGFDKQTIVLGNPAVEGTIRRRIRTMDVSVEYPLSDVSSVVASVPYIDQRATLRSAAFNGTQAGRGLGDIGVYYQRLFPEIARGTDINLSVGMVLPTGKDPFGLGVGQLPTGVGFYQPVARVTLRKLRVPLQFFGAFDYGTSFSRTVAGASRKLPDSYGAEVGFNYAFGPEFSSETSVSWNRVSSPFINVPGANVAYLSQALSYQANRSTSIRGAVDVGLTDDSTDAFVGLSLNSRF